MPRVSVDQSVFTCEMLAIVCRERTARLLLGRVSCNRYTLQVNSETDFATRTEQFQSMVQSVASAALASGETGNVLLHP